MVEAGKFDRHMAAKRPAEDDGVADAQGIEKAGCGLGEAGNRIGCGRVAGIG